MAPEQLRGEGVDGLADVFNLGVMTFEMLTGRLPYGSGSFIDIGMKQAAGPAALDTSGMPANVAEVVRRAIAFNKDTRPGSPGEFASELRRMANSG